MSWTHLGDTIPKARKEYHCDLCGLKIVVGMLHIARRGAFEGCGVTQRMHIDCEQVTHNWTLNDWENSDESEFREEKARFFAKQQEPRKESA